VSDPPYTVRVAATAVHELNRLSEDEQEEVLTWLQQLAWTPLPGGRSGVIRMRGRAADGQPLYYSRTARFGVYHSVSEQDVFILLLLARPQLDTTSP